MKRINGPIVINLKMTDLQIQIDSLDEKASFLKGQKKYLESLKKYEEVI